jgi:hypothetical protein
MATFFEVLSVWAFGLDHSPYVDDRADFERARKQAVGFLLVFEVPLLLCWLISQEAW